jgi:hypothetical protein
MPLGGEKDSKSICGRFKPYVVCFLRVWRKLEDAPREGKKRRMCNLNGELLTHKHAYGFKSRYPHYQSL